jgi:hypothetical protein
MLKYIKIKYFYYYQQVNLLRNEIARESKSRVESID